MFATLIFAFLSFLAFEIENGNAFIPNRSESHFEVRKNFDSMESKTDAKTVVVMWALKAHEWLQEQSCLDSKFLSSESICREIQGVPRHDFRIFATAPEVGNRFSAVFPEGRQRKNFHDGILVLDPFPQRSFGHPILVFYVDTNVTEHSCLDFGGKFFDQRSCLRAIESDYSCSKGDNTKPPVFHAKGCGENVFLPLAYSEKDEMPSQENNKLDCFTGLAGFNDSCPSLRYYKQSDSNELFLRYLRKYVSVSDSCSHSCHRAVLLSGGWNREMSDVTTYTNVLTMRQFLSRQGFSESQVNTFYANGMQHAQRNVQPDYETVAENGEIKNGTSLSSDEYSVGNEEEEVTADRFWPSYIKENMREHIRNICSTKHCVNTLFLYLNSPARPDGSSLLWDIRGDGRIMRKDDNIYKTKEFLRDISHCKAKRVVVVADQSYSAALVEAARDRMSALRNVIIFPALPSAPKDRLTNIIVRKKSYNVCLKQFPMNSSSTYHNSEVFVGEEVDLLHTTLIGSPCSLKSTLLTDSIIQQFGNCQPIPNNS